MPKVSVDYMNARREAKPASGGKVYRLDTNAVDLRAQWQSLDCFERALLQCEHDDIEFRRYIANLQSCADLIAGELPSYGALLAPGESAEDLEF